MMRPGHRKADDQDRGAESRRSDQAKEQSDNARPGASWSSSYHDSRVRQDGTILNPELFQQRQRSRRFLRRAQERPEINGMVDIQPNPR